MVYRVNQKERGEREEMTANTRGQREVKADREHLAREKYE
jgi:hypothetical protein